MHTVGLGLIVSDQFLARIMGVVRQHRGVPDEEGLVCLAAAADEVVDRLHGLAADGKPLVTMPRALRHPFIKTTPRVVALPPLASLQALVAGVPQQLRQRRPAFQPLIHRLTALFKQLLSGRRSPRHARLLRRIVAGDQVLVRIVAGDQRGEARAAEAARNIAPGEDQTFRGQPIEGGRPQLLVPQKGIVPPVLVIGKNQHNVRPGRLRGDRRSHRQHSSSY